MVLSELIQTPDFFNGVFASILTLLAGIGGYRGMTTLKIVFLDLRTLAKKVSYVADVAEKVAANVTLDEVSGILEEIKIKKKDGEISPTEAMEIVNKIYIAITTPVSE